MIQGSLLPVGVVGVHQATPFNSADKAVFVIGSDSQDYVAKLPSPENPALAVAEHLCHFLCARAGIAVPSHVILEFEDGRHAFGSRFEGGVSQFSSMDAPERLKAIQECRNIIFQICVMDAFISNPDRHLDNLLFRTSPFDGRWTVIAMDFSRALWRNSFPETAPSHIFEHGNTATLVRLLGRFGAFDARIPAIVAGVLQAITPERITTCLAELPATLHCNEFSTFTAWWGSDERLRRIDALLELPL
ncbi:MAG: HipA domain-containing protein [Candidatus Accumulibacter sp.]|jgi:hypothetical protein|nr:HipA domain-containing protein [Accumulibacter sp.]